MSIHLQLNLMMLNGNQSMRKTPTSVRKFEDLAVSKGFSQRAGIDFNETFSPVVTYDSIQFQLTLAVRYDMHVHQMDAVCPYLNATLKEVVYVEQTIWSNLERNHK